MPSIAPLILLALPAIAVAIVVGAILLLIGLPWWLAAILAVAAGAAFAYWVHLRAPAAALRALGASEMGLDDEPRLRNVVDGLCVTHGLPEPTLHRHPSGAVNAAVVGTDRGHTNLVVTVGLLDALDRMELEAVAARELCQLRTGTESATLWASLSTLPGGSLLDRLLGSRLDDRAPAVTDMDAVELTRYPPALASALAKFDQHGVDSNPATAPLWVVRPSETLTFQSHPSLEERIDALREL